MQNMILSWLLSVQMLLSTPISAGQEEVHLALSPREQVQETRLWWGLIDPELSAWFARVPGVKNAEEDKPVLWDWSWRGFLAAIFGVEMVKEAPDAASV